MPDIYVAPKKSGEEKEKPPMVEPPMTETSEEPTGGSLSAFVSYPDNVHFNTQEEKEQIILLLRKHWVTNIPWLVSAVLLFLTPSVFFPLAIARGFLPVFPANFWFILNLFWYLVAFGFTLVNFIGWYFNVYIVTNERIVDVDFHHLLYKQMSATRIGCIQDLTYKLGGIIRTLFDFGDVFIQTAGTEPNFEFEAVPHPEQVVRTISELTKKTEEGV